MITPDGILYIEPSKKTSAQPMIDEATRKMTAALRLGTPGRGFRGWHTCACGANSSNCDYMLSNGERTNSLCVHYLAFHRADVSKEQLQKVLALQDGEAEPTEKEMRAGMKSESAQETRLDHGWKPGMR